jgi:hypothetical protein
MRVTSRTPPLNALDSAVLNAERTDAEAPLFEGKLLVTPVVKALAVTVVAPTL